jgi:Cof subfamily protein (haloacid dehalogenase superfamily)
VQECALIKLIGIDVDGTLLDSSGRLPHENVVAIREAVDAGIQVALVTGRSYPWAKPVADLLPDSITLIVSNGAVQRSRDGGILDRRLLPQAVARQVLETTREFRASAALIFDRVDAGQIVFETMDWGHPGRKGYFERNRRFIAHAATLEAALTEDPIQVMFNGGVERMRELAPRLRGVAECTLAITEYESRDFTLLDVTSPEATKGRALRRRAEALGVQPDEVMAVGDNFNDLEMLESAGLAVVMGNAVADLKTRGWPVTADQDHAGLAQAIRRFALRTIP